MPTAQGADDRGSSVLQRLEPHHRGRPTLGQRHQLHDRLGDDAQRALGADEQLHQPVAAGALAQLAAQPQHLTVGQDHGHARHVVGGDPVLHAAHAPRVARDVAADGAHPDTGRVGRIHEAVDVRGLVQLPGDDAGARHGDRVVHVDLEPRQPLQADDDAPGQRDGAPHQAGARAASHDRRPGLVAGRDDRGNLLGAPRPHHREQGVLHEGGVVRELLGALAHHHVGLPDRGGQAFQEIHRRSG